MKAFSPNIYPETGLKTGVSKNLTSSDFPNSSFGIFSKFLYFPACCLWSLLVLFSSNLNGAEIPPDQVEFFESRIRPVLAQECYECHNSRGKAKSGLILDHREALLAGGDSGPAIVAGKAHESLLIDAMKHLGDLTMPKAGVKLDPPIIADFERWINMGAPDPRDRPPSDRQLAEDTNWEAIFKTRRNWWSFQPVETPPGARRGGSRH